MSSVDEAEVAWRAEAMRPLCSPAVHQRWLYCLGDPVPTPLVAPVVDPAWRMEPGITGWGGGGA